jgi:WD40 repeat protein
VYCIATNGAFEDVVISGGGDDKAYLWSLEDGMRAHVLEGHTDSVTACGFNYTGQLAATGALDGTVKVWNCSTGELMATLEGPEDGIQVCI